MNPKESAINKAPLETQTKHPFVNYAHTLLAQKPAINTLHHLEKKHAINPNLVIFFIWFAQSERGRLSGYHIKRVLDNLCSWRERISNTLEKIHGAIETKKDRSLIDIKNSLKSEATFAEEIEQCLIADTLLKTPYAKRSLLQQLADTCHTIFQYAKVNQTYFDGEDWQEIALLLQLSFPSLDRALIQKACDQGLSRSLKRKQSYSGQLSFDRF